MNHSILHVITTIELGGAEKQLLTLAACQREAGFDVEVLFLKDNPTLLQDFLEKGVKVDLTFAKLGFLRQFLKLKGRKSQENLVVHAHLPRAELLCALSLKPKSFIVTRHNSEAFFPAGPAKLSRLLSRFVLKKAFASISISKAVASYLESSGEMSYSLDNHVIYYGLEDNFVSTKEKPATQSQVIQLGTVSRLVTQKNIPLLLRVLKDLNSQDSSRYQLTIVGSGPLKRELESLSETLGVKEAVCWKGQLQDTASFYRSLDFFVFTSDYEGFGLVLLEAMSQGIPVIARRISAIPEVLGDSHPGLVDSGNSLDFARKICDVSDNCVKLNNYLEYQALQLKNFSIKRTQKAHELLYSRLLATKMQE